MERRSRILILDKFVFNFGEEYLSSQLVARCVTSNVVISDVGRIVNVKMCLNIKFNINHTLFR